MRGKRGAPGLACAVDDTCSLHSASHASWLSGIAVALASNLINNLPAGLIAGSAVATAHVPSSVASAILIGVDLGPNLSVTGSLATILWLTALRREGIDVGAFAFLIGIGGSSRLRPCHTTRHAGPHRAVREVEVM
ncbi:ArsB/NhaD family transporter [Paraburkholderia sp. GAS334]|uniref:ArsB/NhaD family transporter n=1 Tax=Paraburkholderia sp. GAS334 TaxID=3035131 RepID=UPI003D20934E